MGLVEQSCIELLCNHIAFLKPDFVLMAMQALQNIMDVEKVEIYAWEGDDYPYGR